MTLPGGDRSTYGINLFMTYAANAFGESDHAASPTAIVLDGGGWTAERSESRPETKALISDWAWNNGGGQLEGWQHGLDTLNVTWVDGSAHFMTKEGMSYEALYAWSSKSAWWNSGYFDEL